jgi:hypothetical protein
MNSGRSFSKLTSFADGVTVSPETVIVTPTPDPKAKPTDPKPEPVSMALVSLTVVQPGAGRVAVAHLTATEALAVAEELAGQAFALDPSLRGPTRHDAPPPSPEAIKPHDEPAATHDGHETNQEPVATAADGGIP